MTKFILLFSFLHALSNSLLLISDDDNRIVLQPIRGRSDCQNDYINACYIDVSYTTSTTNVTELFTMCNLFV